MRIYLDNCCFNRPFDDQAQIRIRLETEAKLKIQDDILQEKFQLVWSYILEAENTANPFDERKRLIKEWSRYAIIYVKENSIDMEKAKKMIQLGIRNKDALHISCAITAGCNYFLSTDDKILERGKLIDDLLVADPIRFIKEVYI
jgi:predicted nucleic acid-binding protein